MSQTNNIYDNLPEENGPSQQMVEDNNKFQQLIELAMELFPNRISVRDDLIRSIEIIGEINENDDMSDDENIISYDLQNGCPICLGLCVGHRPQNKNHA